MSEPTMDDMCICGKNYGDHIGPRCPDGSGTSFTDAAYVAEIAAAEERGRRRGLEEAASQCATTCDAAPWTERWGAHPPPWVVTRAVRDAIEALAPRDSAPARYCSSEHPDRPLRCGRFVQHDGPHTAYDPDYSFENRTAVHWAARK